MTTLGKGFKVTSDGKIVKRPPRMSVSDKIKQRNSKRTRPISKKAAAAWNSIQKMK